MNAGAAVLEREQYRCARCGAPIWGGSVHHRKLRSQGGDNSAANLVALCGSGTTGCHGWAHHNRDAAARAGWVVQPWAEPAAIPVELWVWGWALLQADHTVQLVDRPPGGDARQYANQ